MAWTYNGTRIYAQEWEGAEKQIMPRLQPLDAGTILQIFGYESPIYKIQAIVVGDTNLNALRALINDGTAYTLAGPDSLSLNLYLASINHKRRQVAYQFIDTSQDCETPVYDVTMELYA